MLISPIFVTMILNSYVSVYRILYFLPNFYLTTVTYYLDFSLLINVIHLNTSLLVNSILTSILYSILTSLTLIQLWSNSDLHKFQDTQLNRRGHNTYVEAKSWTLQLCTNSIVLTSQLQHYSIQHSLTLQGFTDPQDTSQEYARVGVRI